MAFAFFVTDIKNTPDLKEYIVILDDPMSSFDSERKNTTIKVLRDELTNGEWEPPDQLIVLTHEDNFFRFLNDIFQDQEKKFLKVNKFHYTHSKSHSLEWLLYFISSCFYPSERLWSQAAIIPTISLKFICTVWKFPYIRLRRGSRTTQNLFHPE